MTGETPHRPSRSIVLDTRIPQELKDLPQWVLWKYEWKPEPAPGKWTKVPYSAHRSTDKASSTDPATWAPFERAWGIYSHDVGDGIGFVFTPPYIGVDFDYADTEIEIISFSSYAEKSPSGRGYHVICKGILPDEKGKKKGDFEIYTTGRYFTVTGRHLEGTPETVNEAQDAINQFIAAHFPTEPDKERLAQNCAKEVIPPADGEKKPDKKDSLSDDEIIAKAASAKNRDKFSSLWHGSTAGYPSHSEADMALCSLLTFYADSAPQIDRLFRRSGLYRDKWDEKHGTGTYGDMTISQAMSGTREHYTPPRHEAHTLKEINERADTQEWAARLKGIAQAAITWEDVVVNEGRKNQRVEKTVKVDFPLFAELVSGLYHVVGFNGTPWIYQAGVYRRNEGEIEKTVLKILELGNLDGRGKETTKEIIFRVTYSNNRTEYPFNLRKDLIPLKNGVLQMSLDGENVKAELLQHSPEYMFAYQLPATYDPAASTEPVKKVLLEWVSEADIVNLIQLPAQSLLQVPGQVFKKSYIFEGPRDAGKSTYFDLLLRFMGEENVAGVDLCDLCKNQFAFANLEFKLLNIYDDMHEFKLEYVGKFKKVTGGIHHRIERKGRDAYDGVLTCVHAFSCNRPPTVGPITDDAFWRRFNYTVFEKQFDIDPSWATRTFTPPFLSGFLNIVIEMIGKMMKTGGLSFDMLSDEVKDTWVRASEPLANFLAMFTKKDVVEYITHEEFYINYVDYCTREKKTPYTKTRVTVLMDQLGYPSPQKRTEDKKRPRVYSGLKWTETFKPKGGDPGQVMVS